MFQKIFSTFFVLFFPIFVFAETGSILVDENLILSGEIENIQVEENIFNTNFKIIFQNPSYVLDRELEKQEYICDEEKDECKVNFKLISPEGKDLSSKLYCEIDFGFESNQSAKCNPTTVIFPEGENNITFKVFENNNIGNFTIKNLLINKIISTGEEDTGTGEILEESGTGIVVEDSTGSGILEETGSGFLIPEPVIEVQSGLEYSGSGEIWTCKKEECKINLTVENIFTGSFDSKNYECLWSFTGGVYSTGTLEKCNPGYIDYGFGEYKIDLKLFEKGNISNLKESYILIKNIKEVTGEEENTGTGNIVEESGTGVLIEDNTGSGILEETSSGILIPEPLIEVQSGLEYSGSGEIWTCKKEECKINLTAENIFTGSFDSKDYECLWSFTGGTYSTGTLEKCNPGYVDYPLGEYKIDLKVFEKGNISNFKESFISIKNIKEVVVIAGGGSATKRTKPEVIKEIIVQSGLELQNGKYICKKEECRVNFKYDKSYKDICLWDFGGGRHKEKYLHTCNPGIVYYSPGEYDIKLKLFKDNILFGERKIAFSNFYRSYKQINNRKPKAEITLQGKMTKSKSFSGNLLICSEVDKCSVNLTGEDSFDIDKNNLLYKWDLGNGEISEKSNPKGIWYLPGKYTISLEIDDQFGGIDNKQFFIEVIGKKKKEKVEILEDIEEVQKEEEYLEKDMFLQITQVLPNPKGTDNNEWIEIKNIGEYEVNLKGLIIDDILDKGSKAYTVKEDIFLQYNQVHRLYKFDTKLSLNNTGDEVNLIYNKKIIDKLSRNFSVRDNLILTHKNLEIKRQKVFVERVIDGDTIVIILENGETEKLRLIGVDTPETKHPRKKIEFYGEKASVFTKKYLEGKTVILETDSDNYRDKYSRLLGYIFIEEENEEIIFFNKLLIEYGQARGYYKYPFKYSQDFIKVEKIAKKQKLGLWQDKEITKVFSKQAKEDKKVLEKTLKDVEEDNNLFTDLDNNNIPDVFEEYEIQTIKKDNKEVITFTPNKKIKNYESYSTFIQNSFILKVSTLKSGVKISGKTLPNSGLSIFVGDKEINLTSDSKGDFIYLLNDITEGKYQVKVELKDSLGNVFLINKTKDFELDKDYISVLITLKQEKRLKEIKKQQRALVKSKKVKKSSTKSSSKSKTKVPKPVTLKLNNFVEIQKEITLIPVFFMEILMFVIFLLFSFIILKKGGILNSSDLGFFKNKYRKKVLLIID